MASLSFAFSLPLFRNDSTFWPISVVQNNMPRWDNRLNKSLIRAVSRKTSSKKSIPQVIIEDSSDDEQISTTKSLKSSKKSTRRSRKKITEETPDNSNADPLTVMVENRTNLQASSSEDLKKDIDVGNEENVHKISLIEDHEQMKKRVGKKGSSSSLDVVKVSKKDGRRKTRKRSDGIEMDSVIEEIRPDESQCVSTKGESERLVTRDDDEDISKTYGWPPLVCCYGTAQHSFIPSGRPANRLIDHEIHESMKDMFWTPTKFVRAPGGSSSSVAVALASLGGRVAFMGKLGDDEYGQSILFHLNDNNVQTRAIKIDDTKSTAISYMKMSRRGGLRMNYSRPCVEDSFLSSDINIDVLKEAKMFYFNSSALLEPGMKETALLAIQIAKKYDGKIFFDVNLPLPLWKSPEETKAVIQQAWNFADFIEVTKQELEFLCGIEPIENFDTKINDRSKFIHYKSDVVRPLWHENLKVLFVTNGTSKIHYYTEMENGCVHGMEDAPITPFTADMSAAGDAVVAALMRMLTVQPHLAIDKGYLEHMIRYAIDCGVIDQWLLAQVRGHPPKEGMGGVRSISEREYRSVGPEDD